MSANDAGTYFSRALAVVGYSIAVLIIMLNLLVLCGFIVLVLHSAFGIEFTNPLDWLPADWRLKLA
jgi:hypothetical protein